MCVRLCISLSRSLSLCTCGYSSLSLSLSLFVCVVIHLSLSLSLSMFSFPVSLCVMCCDPHAKQASRKLNAHIMTVLLPRPKKDRKSFAIFQPTKPQDEMIYRYQHGAKRRILELVSKPVEGMYDDISKCVCLCVCVCVCVFVTYLCFVVCVCVVCVCVNVQVYI